MVTLAGRNLWTPEFQAAADRNHEAGVLLWTRSLPVPAYLRGNEGVLNTFTKPNSGVRSVSEG